MPSPRSLRRVTVLLLLGAVLLSGFIAYALAQRMGQAQIQATGLHRLELYTASLQREISKFAFLPGTLELQKDVVNLLTASADSVPRRHVEGVNAYLEQLNDRAGTLSIYLINLDGRVVATSNWRRPDSFMGEDLRFRAYFRDALSTGAGRLFGIGTTRGEPGYYLASALLDGSRTVGVAVTKVSLDQLEQSWSTVEAPVIVSDENGVVILSSVPDWKFTALKPLDEGTRKAFDQTLQYNRRALKPLDMRVLSDLDQGARVVRVAREGTEMASVYPVTGRFLTQSRALPGTPWTLTVFSHLARADEAAQSYALIATIGAAFLALLAFMLNERRRHVRDRLAAREALQAAHDELERKVEQRTADLSSTNERLQSEVQERTRAEETLRAAQNELVQAGKLAVIGQLATGVAHELNQPLTALRTLSGNSVRFLERGDLKTVQVNLERIAQLADRMGLITGELRSFARKSSGQPQRVEMRAALANALSVLEPRIRQTGALVQMDLSQPEPVAWCDGNRVEQVLVNLINNALDAMQGESAPVVDIRCEQHDDRVQVQIRDHGPGLSPDAQTHLFEPFFTTKGAGEGLGLGLALSAGIVQESGGTLGGSNHPEGGAVFHFTLPAAKVHTQDD
ncbi:sensor histidine kinase [Acidovorax sp. DW039]|uniref:sensor histidine kinase n=1 Tax=Acidovorax sp. DW039 TaxID=3095606 RepID=UPI00308585EC|nr:sensor histidine kinase [Acidovorax sp. DW039]